MDSFLRLRKPVFRLICLVTGFAAISLCSYAQALPGGLICGTGPSRAHPSSTIISAAQALAQLDLPPADTLPEPAVVDVMFLFTPRALTGAGEEWLIRDKVLESVAIANHLFTNSQINLQINPVFVGRINYTESGALDTDAARLANGEGTLSRAASLRNDYKADIVCLIVELENMGADGYAYDIPDLRGNASTAFLAIRRVAFGGGPMVLAHELGHLFGCSHDREHAGDLNAPWLKERRSYIFGHRLEIEGVTYADIMSYEPGIHLPYFGNPRISIDNVRLGIPEGETRPSDPARTINETAPYVASYRTALSRVSFESSQYEVTGKSGSVALKLKRTGDLNTSTRVTVSIGADSTAKAGMDYIRPQTMTVAFATNQSEAAFTIPIATSNLQDAAKTLQLSLTSPLGSHGIGWQGETFIVLHHVPPIVASIVRGADGNVLTAVKESAGTVEVRLELPPLATNGTYPESLKWRLESGSAQPGEDYIDATGEIAVRRVGLPTSDGFSISLIPESFGITLLDDNKPEPDKVFRLIVEGVSVTGPLDGETYVYAPVTNIIRLVDDDHVGAALSMPDTPPVLEKGMNLAVRHDGKFLAWSGPSAWKPLDRLGLALLEPDGTISPSFRPANFLAGHREIEGVGAAQIATVEFLPGGRFLVAGEFSRINGQARSGIARLNADGSLDESFGRDLAFDGGIRAICGQPNGKILVGGSFEKINGQRHAFIARLNSDGSIDETFNPDGGPSSDWTVIVVAIALQTDGKILIGGLFEKVDGISALNIARLLPDGRLDTRFKLKNTSGPVGQIALQTDGRIILAGRFDTVGGGAAPKLARVNADGSNDLTFHPAQLNGDVREVLSLPDGRLLITGSFTMIGNSSRRFLALLNRDGTLNQEFDPGTGPDQLLGPFGSSVCRAMTLNADGSLYIAGQFQRMNGLPAGGIVRLKFGDPGSAITDFAVKSAGDLGFRAQVFPGGVYAVEATSDFAQWLNVGSIITGGYRQDVLVTLRPEGNYRFFRLTRPSWK